MKTFSFRWAFRIAMILVVIFSLGLLVVSFLQHDSLKFRILLIVALTPFYYLFLESQIRKIIVTEDKIVVRRIVGTKKIAFADISRVDVVAFGKKAFLVIRYKESFQLFTNSYARFVELVKIVSEKITPEQTGEGIEEFLKLPRSKYTDVIAAWMAAILFLLVLLMKLDIIK